MATSSQEFSVTGALVGALAGLVTEITIQELTGHHVTSGVLEIIGAVAGLLRLDRRLAKALAETLHEARHPGEQDYRQVKQRITELTADLPELREILQNLVEEGIRAQQA